MANSQNQNQTQPETKLTAVKVDRAELIEAARQASNAKKPEQGRSAGKSLLKMLGEEGPVSGVPQAFADVVRERAHELVDAKYIQDVTGAGDQILMAAVRYQIIENMYASVDA